MLAIHHSIVRSLLPYGLDRTLLARPDDGGYTVNRLVRAAQPYACRALAALTTIRVQVIGRIGPPDPRLGLAWSRSLTFYGQRFDAMARSDPEFGLRRKIAAASDSVHTRQLARDDHYAIVGSYYSAFRTIMSVKRRTPLVLLSDTLSTLASFPVVLVDLDDRQLAGDLATSLRLLLRNRGGVPAPAVDAPAFQRGAAVDDGIEVEELSAEDFEKYFAAPRAPQTEISA